MLEKVTILAEHNTEIQNALSGTQLAISNYLFRVFKTTQIWDIEDPLILFDPPHFANLRRELHKTKMVQRNVFVK